MAKKEFLFHGKKLEEVKSLSLEAFAAMLPSRQRRCITRMMAATDKDERRTLYKDIKKNAGGKVKTHARNFVIIPEMVGMVVAVHNGKEFKEITITEKMLGRFLGEFANTRAFQQHSAPGIGASRSTKFVSVRA